MVPDGILANAWELRLSLGVLEVGVHLELITKDSGLEDA